MGILMSMCGRIEDLEGELKSLQESSPCKAVCFIGPSGNCEACFRSISDIQEAGKRAMELRKMIKELKDGNC
ncbi:DUF1289 domain-containing protein [bacterium]|nr:DUF1289 domain-containing protein [bacterium]